MLNKKEMKKEDIEFPLSFLVIAPSFVYFYLDTFWYSLAILGSVSLLGFILAKLFEKKSRNSIETEELFVFLIAWFIIFSVGYAIGSLWDYVSSFWEAPSVPIDVEPSYSEIPGDEHVPIKEVPFLTKIKPSLIYLGAMFCVLLLKIYEHKSLTKKALSENALCIMAIIPGIIASFSELYILSLILNIFIFIQVATIIIEYNKKTDPSAGSIWFIYMFILLGVVSLSLMYQAYLFVFGFL